MPAFLLISDSSLEGEKKLIRSPNLLIVEKALSIALIRGTRDSGDRDEGVHERLAFLIHGLP
jgi:hypothetical protein